MLKRGYTIFVVATLLIVASHSYAELRDPTRPSSYSAPSTSNFDASGLVITSIIHSKKRRLAIVNGELLQAGDKIGGLEVVKISPRKVRFKNANKIFDIPIASENSVKSNGGESEAKDNVKDKG